MQWNNNLDDEPLQDGSVPISGSIILFRPMPLQRRLAEEADNRLAEPDGLNRPRPGLIQRVQTPGSFDSIFHARRGPFPLE